MKSLENVAGLQDMSLQEMEEINGGIIPILVALAWGFGLGFTGGIAIGVAKYF